MRRLLVLAVLLAVAVPATAAVAPGTWGSDLSKRNLVYWTVSHGKVQGLTVNFNFGPKCTGSAGLPKALAIRNGRFSYSGNSPSLNAGKVTVSGRFVSSRKATGTARVSLPGCKTLSFTAIPKHIGG